jgi:hypothetical protein
MLSVTACVADSEIDSETTVDNAVAVDSECRPSVNPLDLSGNNRLAFSPPDRPRPTAGPAKMLFDAFAADRYDLIPVIIAAFETELAKPPTNDPAGNDQWLPLAAGLTYLWQSAESARDPSFTPAQAQANINKASANLAQASARNPTDKRVDSFTGAININLGRALINVPVPEVQAQGRALFAEGNRVLNAAYNQWPEFHGFTYSFVRATAPAPTAQELDEAIAGVVTGMQYCFGSEVQYNGGSVIELDVRSKVRRGFESGGFRRVCGNSWIVPHSSEGFFLLMGDVFARRGRPADLRAAKQLYRNATASPSFNSWGFKSTLINRILGVEARAALYQDADPTNDPFIGPKVSQCVVCHAVSASPRVGD